MTSSFEELDRPNHLKQNSPLFTHLLLESSVPQKLLSSNIFWLCHPRPLFAYVRSFQAIYRIKTVDFIGIRTRIVGVEGEHADHLTTNTPRISFYYLTNVSLITALRHS